LAAAFEVYISVALECPVVDTAADRAVVVVATEFAVTMFATVVATYPQTVAVMVVMAVANYPAVADKTVVAAIAVAYTVHPVQIDLVDRVAAD